MQGWHCQDAAQAGLDQHWDPSLGSAESWTADLPAPHQIATLGCGQHWGINPRVQETRLHVHIH